MPAALGGDHLHSGTVVGKLEGDRDATLGWIDLMRDAYVPTNRSRGIFFDQDWGSMPGMFPVASGGIHVWHIPALVSIFGDDAVFQFGGGTLGHPWGNAAGAPPIGLPSRPAPRLATPARTSNARARGAARRGRHSPALAAAMETWKEITFDFDTVDKLDIEMEEAADE